MKLRKLSSSVYPITFLMVQSADHVTGLTGATVTVTLSKNGGAFASPAGAVTEIGSGWYSLAANATDRDTLGELDLHATATGGDPTDEKYLIVSFDPFDATALGLSRIDEAISAAKTLTASERTSLAGVIWAALTNGITTAGSIGKLIVDYLDAAISSRSTYAGGDTAGTTTLLSRILGTLASGTHKPQSGDAYVRLGAPAGASVSADIAGKASQATVSALLGTDTTQFSAHALELAPAGGGGGSAPSADENAAAVWSYQTTLMTVIGSIGKALAGLLAVFNGSMRTLTSTAEETAAAQAGAAISITKGVSYSKEINNIAYPPGWIALLMTAKRSTTHPDSAAVLQMRLSNPPSAESDGVIILSGLTDHGVRDKGGLSPSEIDSTLTITLAASVTALLSLEPTTTAYDLKFIMPDDDAIKPFSSAPFGVVATETKAIL
jgi:hypothetical protein